MDCFWITKTEELLDGDHPISKISKKTLSPDSKAPSMPRLAIAVCSPQK